MAGKSIRIAVVADAAAAKASVSDFAATVDTKVKGAATGLDSAAKRAAQSSQDLAAGFDRAADGADNAVTKAQGFRDSITGTQDAMAGAAAIAKGDLVGGLLLAGSGVADLAGGFANFLIPMAGKAAGAMKALNFTFLTNPVFLVVAGIVALVAILVVAYTKSETFRKIVDGAFRGVLNVVRGVWNWIKGNWPLLLAVITGPIGIAVLAVIKNFDRIKGFVKGIPDAIKGAFSNAKNLLTGVGRDIVNGLRDGISGAWHFVTDKVRSLIDAIPGPIRKILGIASPSKVFRKIGQQTGQGLALGLLDQVAAVRKASSTLASIPAARPVTTRLEVPVSAAAGQAAATAAAGRQPIVVQLQVGSPTGGPVERALLTWLRETIRIKGGGNVQVTLGTGRA